MKSAETNISNFSVRLLYLPFSFPYFIWPVPEVTRPLYPPTPLNSLLIWIAAEIDKPWVGCFFLSRTTLFCGNPFFKLLVLFMCISLCMSNVFFVVQKVTTPGSAGRRIPSAEHAALPLGGDKKGRELEEERRREYNEFIKKVLVMGTPLFSHLVCSCIRLIICLVMNALYERLKFVHNCVWINHAQFTSCRLNKKCV